MLQIPKDILENKKLILNLSKNDFKSKFAGSYFGIIWAFIQPIITIIVYWFVFDKALNAGTQITKAGINVPYVIWLVAGMVPWFYFSEVVNTGSNVLVEYNYLVKKVVFKISVLPVVKIISSLFVHLFFVGIIYATSAMTVFFRDLTQLINIVLQILMWMTPIMWNMDAMVDRISKPIEIILKLNPMYYIVSGYRDSMINGIWFWDRPITTIYFWGITIVLFIVGSTIFKKLQVHFADVL